MICKYYVLDVLTHVAIGPFSFKEAVKKNDMELGITIIVKVVVDENGKEVK